MDERLGGKNHKLTLFNRSSVQMTGIVDVISFDTNEIVMDTEDGLLLLRGEDLHVNHLTRKRVRSMWMGMWTAWCIPTVRSLRKILKKVSDGCSVSL